MATVDSNSHRRGVSDAPSNGAAVAAPSYTLFPPTSKSSRPRSKSARGATRRPLPLNLPPMPTTCDLYGGLLVSPSNTWARTPTMPTAFLEAALLDRSPLPLSPMDKIRTQSVSSEASIPSLDTDHSDSDFSQDERDHIAMNDFIDSYSSLAYGSRFADQEYTVTRKPVQSAHHVVLPVDRVWATDVASPVELSADSEEAAFKVEVARQLHHSRSFSNLQRSPPRRRLPRNHPDVLSTIQLPKFELPVSAGSAPLPGASTQDNYDLARSETIHVHANFDTWPPRSTSSASVPTLNSFRAPLGTAPNFPLPPLPRPRRSLANINASRSSTAGSSEKAKSPLSETFPPVPILEKSVWEDDDDDTVFQRGHSRGDGSFSKIFQHTRNLSNSSKKSAEQITIVTEVPAYEKKAKCKRSPSEVWKSMFGIGPKKSSISVMPL